MFPVIRTAGTTGGSFIFLAVSIWRMGETYVAPGTPTDGPLSFEELQLATRNRGMPLEALRYDLTPTGLHYLLIHFDIPVMDASDWRLRIGGAVDNPIELEYADLLG